MKFPDASSGPGFSLSAKGVADRPLTGSGMEYSIHIVEKYVRMTGTSQKEAAIPHVFMSGLRENR